MNNTNRRKPKGRNVPSNPNTKNISVSTPELPDTSKWQPRDDRKETLHDAFLKRCVDLEERIILRTQQEKRMNLDNYDSGPAVEGIIREEINNLLPDRYSVRSGTINDRIGRTAGDCDLIVFNNLWFPEIKSGATEDSRKYHYPIDGVYSVCEIKQSIDYNILDKAMEKLVMAHRLSRPLTDANRIVENFAYDGCFHGLKNPLYSAVVATSLRDGVDFQKLVERFYDINKTLKRLEIVRCLCVLGKGTITWGYFDNNSQEGRPTLFMREDIFAPIFPVYHEVPQSPSAFYAFVADLMLHLYHSVLPAEDIAVAYGIKNPISRRPVSDSVSIQPDEEWIEKLRWEKDDRGRIVPIGGITRKKKR